MKSLIIVFISMFIFLAANIQEVGLPKGAQKKVDKSIAKLWPDQTIHTESVSFNNKLSPELIRSLRRTHLFELQGDNGDLKGYMFLSAAPSRYDYFDFMVIYDTDLNIIDLDILIYRESYGGEIGSNRWLRQFLGMDSTSQMQLDYDIQGISGATISVRSATVAFRNLTKALTELKNKGVI